MQSHARVEEAMQRLSAFRQLREIDLLQVRVEQTPHVAFCKGIILGSRHLLTTAGKSAGCSPPQISVVRMTKSGRSVNGLVTEILG